eukprot:45209-Eustigmatos_ZCMA.PRE.1
MAEIFPLNVIQAKLRSIKPINYLMFGTQEQRLAFCRGINKAVQRAPRHHRKWVDRNGLGMQEFIESLAEEGCGGVEDPEVVTAIRDAIQFVIAIQVNMSDDVPQDDQQVEDDDEEEQAEALPQDKIRKREQMMEEE